MPRDTINTSQATPMAVTLAHGKALDAIRSIPGINPQSGHSVAEYEGGRHVFSQQSSTRADRRNLEEIRRILRCARSSNRVCVLALFGKPSGKPSTPCE